VVASDHAVEVEGLAKSFGAVQARRDVSLHVRKGEVYGLLGLNDPARRP
jgi:ABC-type sugar transport system ATPase subunit